MALKIDHIDQATLTGVLDDAHRFEIVADGETIVARVNTWSREMTGRTVRSIKDMRLLAYEALARFREATATAA